MKEARPTTMEERIQIAKDCIANGENYGETALKYNHFGDGVFLAFQNGWKRCGVMD